MIDWSISFGNVLTAIVLFVSALWWASKLHARSERNADLARDAFDRASEAKTQAAEAMKQVSEVRLEMTRDFASVNHLKEVETRLATTISELTAEIRSLRSYLMEGGKSS